MTSKFGVGQSVRRREDPRFIRGEGRYTADVTMPGMVHAIFVRSPVAHATITSLDIANAASMPGVLGVLTGQDLVDANIGTLPCNSQIPTTEDGPIYKTPREALVTERVRFVGEAVAMVIAETKEQALDAAEAVMVDYDEHDVVTDIMSATKLEAPQLWADAPGNICFKFQKGDAEATADAFDNAHHHVSLDFVNNRVIAAPIEPRAVLADFADGTYRLHVTGQNIHNLRRNIAGVLKVDADDVHVIAPDVGGSFGMKNMIMPEWVACAHAAKVVGLPVRWVGERSEGFVADLYGRDHATTAELALTQEGDITGLRIHTHANMGAQTSMNGPLIPTLAQAPVTGGVYAIPAIDFRVTGVFTNTAPVDAYRGAGRPEASFLMERLMDYAAQKIGMDRVELRRRNFIARAQCPYKTAMGAVIDDADFATALDRVLDMADIANFASRQNESAARGKKRGFGLASYIEVTLGPPEEKAELQFSENGDVLMLIGTHNTGQGHWTAYSQLLHTHLGLDFDKLSFLEQDSKRVPFGNGHGGSRSMQIGGSALLRTMDVVREKAQRIAAHQLEVSEMDLRFEAGRFTVLGTDRSMTLQEIIPLSFDPAHLPEGMEPGLDTRESYSREAQTFPNGCHLAEIEVDPETGVIDVLGYWVADDFGMIINPLLVKGQIMGGVAMGLGQAITENCVHDATGQLLSGSFMDYGMPRADDMPPMEIDFCSVPTETNPAGVKGCGEAGCIGAPSAISNALIHALEGSGIAHIDMPLTPERVWQTMRTT